MYHPTLISAFLRWALFHSALARGWWLATAVYLVVVADLLPSQLILIGVFQGITVVIAEIPAGVIADDVSRRLAVVLSHVVMGTGMAMTAFVTDFALLVVSNCLWGLGWALVSGADIAWITDELDRPASSMRYSHPRHATVFSAPSWGSCRSELLHGRPLCRPRWQSPDRA